MKSKIAALILVSVPALVSANEQQRSQDLCFEAYAKGDQKFMAVSESHCKIANNKPPAFWECVIDRMDDGETMDYAVGRCDK